MLCQEIMKKLEELSPLTYAENWDNVGLLVGRADKEVTRICIVLDVTDEIVERAITENTHMIISHHPLIFKPVERVNSENMTGRRLLSLIQNDICVYAMHTNFDVMGMADAAADEIALKDRNVLNIIYEDEISKEGCGRYGKLPKAMSLEACAQLVKMVFQIKSVRVYGNLDQTVETAAIMPGSGGDMIKDVLKLGLDVMITGDIKHHEGLDAVGMGLAIIDAGHFELEKIFIPYMKEFIERNMNGIIVSTPRQTAPYQNI